MRISLHRGRHWARLDVDRLYLTSGQSGRGLQLLPLVEIRSPEGSAKNACYFFNRLEKSGGARFVSYHFVDEPEHIGEYPEAMAAIGSLTDPS